MHVETFSRGRKHARSRPLLRPQSNPRENPFIAPHQFPEAPTMPLRVNLSRENFHARYPSFFHIALILVRGHEFARVHASLRQLLRERCRAIITRCECVLTRRINPLPEICFALGHLPNVILIPQEREKNL
jgi:hypothetical protein